MHLTQIKALLNYYDKSTLGGKDHKDIQRLKLFFAEVSKNNASTQLSFQDLARLYINIYSVASVKGDSAAETVFDAIGKELQIYSEAIEAFLSLPKNLRTEINLSKILQIDKIADLKLKLAKLKNVDQKTLDVELQKITFLNKVEKTGMQDRELKQKRMHDDARDKSRNKFINKVVSDAENGKAKPSVLRLFSNNSDSSSSMTASSVPVSSTTKLQSDQAIIFRSSVREVAKNVYMIYREKIQKAITSGIQEFLSLERQKSLKENYGNVFDDFIVSILKDGISNDDWDKYFAPNIAKHIWHEVEEVRNLCNDNSNNDNFYAIVEVTRQENISHINFSQFLSPEREHELAQKKIISK